MSKKSKKTKGKKKKGKKSKSSTVDIQFSLTNNQLYSIGGAIAVVLIFLFLKSFLGSPKELDNTETEVNKREEIIAEHLIVVALDKTWDIDGKTPVSFKNTSNEYVFDIDKIGVKHLLPRSGRAAVVFPPVNITLRPNSSITIDAVAIPNGVKPISAYALIDNIIISRKQ